MSQLKQAKEKVKTLDVENNFYHQSTTLFLTIKKVMETEKSLCFKLANTSSQEKKETVENGIVQCQENVAQLELKLKKLLNKTKQN